MRLNADFSREVILDANDHQWASSPHAGVDRIMLDRIGDEVARATSIVRYASRSLFSRHEHACGEEFLVLEGVFSDEHGNYPQGTYVRNPPESGHSPFSENGCRIFVKLRQFDPQDLAHVVIDTNDATLWESDNAGQTSTLPLHEFAAENVRMMSMAGGSELAHSIGPGGLELLVVSGSVSAGQRELGKESWLRFPADSEMRLRANKTTTLWIKSGHLPDN